MKKYDKKTTQIALPLSIEAGAMKEYVKQHWNITFARQKMVSIYAKRIMALVLGQLQDQDKEFPEYFEIKASDVCNYEESRTPYTYIKTAFEELATLRWTFEDLSKGTGKEILEVVLLINRFRYENGLITVVLNPYLKPYFLELARNYTIYELKYYMTFRSWYSMRLFEILSALKDTGVWNVSIDKFRELMDCEKKYVRTSDLIKYTLAEPLKELAETKMAFNYEIIFDADRNVGRKSVASLKFTILKPQITTIPKQWKEHPNTQRLIEHLKKFKVSEANIIRYSPVLGVDGVGKLINQWQQKNIGKNPIENPEQYCNAAFVRAGKAILKEQEEKL
jgi:plasmid replication initiation protein